MHQTSGQSSGSGTALLGGALKGPEHLLKHLTETGGERNRTATIFSFLTN